MAQSHSTPTSLLEPLEFALLGPAGSTRSLPVGLIDPNPHNPRRALVEIEDLAASIKEFGLLQPITVRANGDRFEVLGGHRRRLAYILLAEQEPHVPTWKVIEAVIKTFDDDTAYRALLHGQLQTKSWLPREEAAALETLASTRTLLEVGRLVGKSEPWVSNRLKVYSDSVLSAYVQTGKILPSVAQEILAVKDAAQRRQYAERAVAEAWSQSEARSEVRKLTADRMIGQIGRLSRDLLAALALVRPEQIPDETGKTLLRLRRRITLMGRGPVMPTIEAAQQAAGVNPDKPRRRRPAGYRAGFKSTKR